MKRLNQTVASLFSNMAEKVQHLNLNTTNQVSKPGCEDVYNPNVSPNCYDFVFLFLDISPGCHLTITTY